MPSPAHALTNYQASIWQRCLEQNPNVPSDYPNGRGWRIEREGSESDVELVVHWITGPPAPQAILDLLSCNRRNVSYLYRCFYMANGLKCTEICRQHNQAYLTGDEYVTNELQNHLEEDYDF